MKKLITQSLYIFIVVLISKFSLAQGVNWASFVQGGTNSTSILATSSAIDSNGDIYISGKFNGSATFGTITLSGIGEEGFIAKLSSSGQVLWVETMGGLGSDAALGVEVDNIGGVYVCGYVELAATFDTLSITPQGVSSFNLYENFVAKYDTSGNAQWVKHGTKRRALNFTSGGNSQMEFENGHLYYSSYYEYQASTNTNLNRTFDGNLLPLPNTSAFRSVNVFVLKTDTGGTNSWIKTIISDGSSFQESVIPDDMIIRDNGNVLIQGRARSGIDIGSTNLTYSGNTYIMYLVELNSLGIYEDSYVMADVGFTNASSYGLAEDNTGNVYALNYRSNAGTTVVLNNLILPDNGTTLLKLDSNLTLDKGNVITTTNTYNSLITNLDVNDGGDLIIGGIVNGSLTLAGSSFSLAQSYFIASCDTSFTHFNWAFNSTNVNTTGSFSSYAKMTSCHYVNNEVMVATGYTSLANHYFGDYSSGVNSTHDGFVMKLVECKPQSVSISPLNSAICGSGGNVVLNGTYINGVSANWMSSAVLISGANNASYFANNPGSYSLQVDSLGCKDTSNVATIILGSQPTVTAPSNSLSICSNAGQVDIPDGTPSGGVWSGAGVVNDTVFDPALTGSGPSLITYTYTNAQGCSGTAVRIANVITPPSLQLTSSLPSFCENDASYGLGSMVYPAGGTYAGSGVNANVFNPNISGVGTHIITYMYSAGIGCLDSISFNLVVNPSPTIIFPSFNAICQTVFSTALNLAIPTGGTYTGNFIISNNFYPFLSGPGTFPITYSVSQSGCSSSFTQSIQVDAPVSTSLNSVHAFCLDDSVYTLTEGSPFGGVYLVNGVIDTVINAAVLGAGTHELRYAFTNACGTDTSSVSFEVNALPVVQLGAVGPLCENVPAITLSQGTPVGGSYYGSVVNAGIFNPSLAGVGNSTIYYSYSDGNGCIHLDSTSVNVTAKPNAILAVDTMLCVDNGVSSLIASIPGGTWTGTGVSGNIFDPSAAGVGIHPVTYLVSNTAGCADTSMAVIDVKGLPTVSLNSFAPICNSTSSAIPLNGGLPLTGVYSGTGVNNGFFNPSVSGAGFHLITYTYTDTFGCALFDTATMTVDTSTVVMSLATLPNVCLNANSIILNGGLPTGGVFSGTAVSGGSFNPVVAGVGNSEVYYSYTAPNACIATISQTITVDTLPYVNFDLVTNLCVDATPVALVTGSPVGGVYSGTGVIAGAFDPFVAGVGITVLTYTFTDGNGCVNSADRNVEVDPIPVVSLTSFSGVCYDSGTVVLSGGSPIGGIYTGTGVINGLFDPVSAGSGFHTITYSVTDTNGCSNFVVDSIEVYQPISTLSTIADVCIDAVAFSLTGGSPLGGVYSGVGINGGQFDAFVSGAGTFDAFYTITENGCPAIDTQTVTVNALPIVNLPGFVDACESDVSYLLSGGFPLGGVYSGNGVSNTNFNPNSVGVGFHTITFTYTDTSVCANSVIDSVRVNANPVLSLVPFTDVCENAAAFTLTGGLPNTGVYFGAGIVNGIFDPSIAGVGNHVISYTDTNSFGCSAVVIDTIEVFLIPTVSLAAFSTVCLDASPVVLSAGIPAGGIYSGTGVLNGVFDPSVSGVGVFDVIYEFTNTNQCVVSDTQQITVNALPIISLANQDSLCVNDSSTPLLGGLPTGGVYAGTGVTNGLFDPSVAGIGTHLITYSFTNTNGCTNDSTVSIVVTGLPGVSLAAIAAMCDNLGVVTLSGGMPLGGAYSGTGVSSGDFDPLLAGAGATLITYTYVGTNGCQSTDTTSIHVHTAPLVVNSIQDTVCMDVLSFNLSGATPTGGIYSGLGVTSGSLNPFVSGTGLIDVIYTYTDNTGCIDSDTGVITVADLPIIDAGNDESICEGNALVLNVTGANDYLWSSGSTADTIQVSPIQTITYAVIGTSLFGCISFDSVTVTVNTNPIVSLGATDSLCTDSVLTLDAGSGFTNYSWSTGASSQTLVVGPYTTSQTVSFDVTATDANGCLGMDTITLDIVNCGPNGIADLESDLSVTVHPNPNAGVFTLGIVDWKSSSAKIKVVSGTGTIVRNELLYFNNGSIIQTFDLSNVANGLYWIVIEGEHDIYRKEIIINK
ncbi:MAG: hypothetical protein ACJAWO_000325 [Halieaceae bacterium]|jgi:hypothetical protein